MNENYISPDAAEFEKSNRSNIVSSNITYNLNIKRSYITYHLDTGGRAVFSWDIPKCSDISFDSVKENILFVLKMFDKQKYSVKFMTGIMFSWGYKMLNSAMVEILMDELVNEMKENKFIIVKRDGRNLYHCIIDKQQVNYEISRNMVPQ